MKTIKFYGLFLLAFIISAAAFSQETVLATAESTTPAEASATPAKEEDEEEAPTFSLSGSVDTYFRTGFGYKSIAPGTAFANQKGFGIGMVNLVASYEGEKVGFVGDLVFGPRGRDAVFNTPIGIVNQLFVYYNLSDKVKLNLGQFNTFLGYEVISPAVNFHYSTSYLFSYGPFSHTGLRADFSLGGGLEAKLAVLNPTDFLEFNPVNTYTIGGQIGHSSDAGGIWLNVLYGDQDGKLVKDDYFPGMEEEDLFSGGNLFQVDLTTGYDISDKFYIGLNTSYQTIAAGEQFTAEGEIEEMDGDATSFFGVAVYPKITFSESFALGLRVEQFMIKKYHLENLIGLDDEGNGSVTTFTLSANYKVGGLTIIPEFRMDMGSEESFADKKSEMQKSLSSFTLAAVYSF